MVAPTGRVPRVGTRRMEGRLLAPSHCPYLNLESIVEAHHLGLRYGKNTRR